VKNLPSRRTVAVVFLFLVAMFVVRPQFGWLRRKAADSLSMELGRPVDIASVHIRFLPRPGLELENLVIRDSDQFGSEPLLRSADVNAWIRISSLLRGRIEISSLSLNDASLNLSRSPQGKWNLEELLQRASRSSTAPTASGRKEPRREFPYIEATQARINFKNGIEKTRFAFNNAEFALWQESDNQWGMRLKARPIRTDANLTDTGIISVNGVWDRSPVLQDTPVRFSLEWKQAQIGQVSKLFSGTDQGWRGNALVDATVSGTLGRFMVVADASVEQLRRQDVAADGNLRTFAHCAAEYSASQGGFANIDCSGPAGDGLVELKGTTTGIPLTAYDLTLLAKGVPAQSVLELIRHVNQNVPQDLKAFGTVNAVISLNKRNAPLAAQLRGGGEALGLRLASAITATDLAIGAVPLRLNPTASKDANSMATASPFENPELQLGPISVTLGRPTPVQAQITLSRSGYRGSVRGEAGVKKLLQAARILRLPAPPVNGDGVAAVNISISRPWAEEAPAVTGTAQLRSVRAQVRGLNSPLLVNRADLLLVTDAVRVSNLDVAAGDTTWHGSLQLPRPCVIDSCEFQFRLRSPQVSAMSLNQLLNPAAAKRPWYRLLSLGSSSDSFFSKAAASGSITIDKLLLGKAVCRRFSSDLALKKGKVSLTNVKAEFFDGKAEGIVKADFSAHPPAYSGSGNLDLVSLATLGRLIGDEWADGTGSARYQFTASGSSLKEFVETAQLQANFTLKNAFFPHVVLNENGNGLRAVTFVGNLGYRQGNFSFDDAELDSTGGVFKVSGKASISGELNLKMISESSGGYTVSGSLAETRVSPIPNPPTQAALKP